MSLSYDEIAEICRNIPCNLYIEDSSMYRAVIADKKGSTHIAIDHGDPDVARLIAKLFIEVPRLLPQLLLQLKVAESELAKRREVMLDSVEMNNGSVDLKISGEPAQYLLLLLVEMLRQNDGENYLTVTFWDKKADKKLAITIQDCTKALSPAEKITSLEKEVESLQRILSEIASCASQDLSERIEAALSRK